MSLDQTIESKNPQTYLHPVGKPVEDPHHADCLELPPTLAEQLCTRKFLCYMIIILVFIIIIVYVSNSTMGDYIYYSRDSGFIDPYILMIGTGIFMLSIAYTAYHLSSSSHHPTTSFWLFILATSMYVFILINLSVRTEYYDKNVRGTGNGGIWLILCLVMCTGLFVISSQVGIGITLVSIIPIIWLLYFIYNWWFKRTTRFI